MLRLIWMTSDLQVSKVVSESSRLKGSLVVTSSLVNGNLFVKESFEAFSFFQRPNTFIFHDLSSPVNTLIFRFTALDIPTDVVLRCLFYD